MTKFRESIYQEIGRRVKSAREQKGMTQTALADMLKLTRTSITNIEIGRQRFNVDTLYRLAFCLETEVMELLPDMPEDMERLRKLRQISDEILRLQERAKELRNGRRIE